MRAVRAPSAAGISSGVWHGAETIPQRAAPGERGYARARHFEEIEFDVAGDTFGEFARVGARQQPVCRARDSMFAHFTIPAAPAAWRAAAPQDGRAAGPP